MFNIFKGFFGPPNSNQDPKNFDRRDDFLKENNDLFSGDNFSHNDDDEMGFNVFTNPLEMHRYFESQLNNILKSFGMPGDGSLFGFSGEQDFSSNFFEGAEQQPSTSGDLRDQYLKPGFYKQQPDTQNRTDSDLDGKIGATDLDSIFEKKDYKIEPYKQTPNIRSFGKQIITKMFTNHNGIVESHQTIKDHQGNEETTITHKRGNQEYTKIIKVDKDGKKEIKENFVNMSEKDVANFLGNKDIPQIQDTPSIYDDRQHTNWFPFDKYFK